MKKFRLFAAIMAAGMLLFGCADKIPEPLVSEASKEPPAPMLPPVQEPYPVSVDGETFDESPMKVVSLSPELTEMMYELGLADRLSGVSDYCDYPEAVEALPDAGSPAEPDTKTITELAPELLLTLSPIAATDILILKQAGVRVMELSAPQSFAELCDLYIKLGLIFYGQADGYEKASQVYLQLDSALGEAQRNSAGGSFVVVEGYADDGLMLSPKGTFSDSLFSAFGTNLWTEPKFNATEDELFEIGPDMVFYADGMDEDDIEKTFPHSELIPVDFERVERPTMRLVGLVEGVTG